MNPILIKDFGNEYVIYRNGNEVCTCYSPEDAERIASLIFLFEDVKNTLHLIATNHPEQYCLDAFKPDERFATVFDVADHARMMLDSYDSGLYEWDLPCPECNGQGCEKCNWDGGHRAYFHPTYQKPSEDTPDV